MSIRDWPVNERPREKLLAYGPAALSDAELLAILLRCGIKGKTALDLARDLLQQHGGLRALLAVKRKNFCLTSGMGEAKYVLLQAVMEMSRRSLYEVIKKGDALTNPEQTQAFFVSQLRDYEHEVFACLYLDNRHAVICFEELFRGTIDGASVHPREVVKQALYHNAAAIIFSHNHPSGIAEPSKQDELITQRLKKSLALVDIRVLDHIIIGNGECVSFAERGLL